MFHVEQNEALLTKRNHKTQKTFHVEHKMQFLEKTAVRQREVSRGTKAKRAKRLKKKPKRKKAR